MTNDISEIENNQNEETALFDRVLAFALVVSVIAIVLVATYYIGAYNTVRSMEISFRDYGEVVLVFNGFVCPRIFDLL